MWELSPRGLAAGQGRFSVDVTLAGRGCVSRDVRELRRNGYGSGMYKINSHGEHLLEENEMITYLLTKSQLKSEGTTPRCSPEIEVVECVK